MTFNHESKYAIVDYDILISELIKSTFSNDCKVIIISPWIQDYSLPTTWPNFSSNFIDIQDMQRISDVLKKLLQNGVEVTLVTHSASMLKSTNWTPHMIKDALEFHERIKKEGGKICYNPKNHGKMTITSENELSGSGNTTVPGRDPARQDNNGHLHQKNTEDYDEALTWALKEIKESVKS